MRSFDYKIATESWARADDARRVNRGSLLVTHHKGKRCVAPLGCGDSDNVYAYKEGNEVFVVSINHSMDYLGLEVFSLENMEKSKYDPSQKTFEMNSVEGGDMFFQDISHLREILGPRMLDLHPRNIAKRLSEYVY